MKKIIIAFTAFASLSAVMSSCSKDDFTGASTIKASNPSITIDAPATISFVEKDTTFEFAVTLSEPQIVDVAIYINVLETSTAIEGEDYAVNNSNGRVLIPAYRTSGVVSVAYIADGCVEGTKTLNIQIGDQRTGNATLTPSTVSMEIADAFPDLDITADWTGTFVYNGANYPMEANVDLDVYVVDSEGDLVTGYTGATAAHPEHMTFPSDMADGTYEVLIQPYDAADFPSFGVADTEMPVVFTFERCPGEATVVDMTLSTDDVDQFYTLNGGVEVYIHVADIVVTNGSIEIVDIATGETSDPMRKFVNIDLSQKKSILEPTLN